MQCESVAYTFCSVGQPLQPLNRQTSQVPPSVLRLLTLHLGQLLIIVY